MIQTLNFEQAVEARKLTDCSHNHVLHGLVKLRRESNETGRVRQRADASFPGHPDVGGFFCSKSDPLPDVQCNLFLLDETVHSIYFATFFWPKSMNGKKRIIEVAGSLQNLVNCNFVHSPSSYIRKYHITHC